MRWLGRWSLGLPAFKGKPGWRSFVALAIFHQYSAISVLLLKWSSRTLIVFLNSWHIGQSFMVPSVSGQLLVGGGIGPAT